MISWLRSGGVSQRLVMLPAALLLAAGCAKAQANDPHAQGFDPGVRQGAPGAGGPVTTLNQTEQAVFSSGRAVFAEVDSVSGTIEAGAGLGPTFNGNSCAMCHAQPAIGGTSPSVNPQFANDFPHLQGALNPVDLSGFLSPNGPVREVRFVSNPDGTPDGGVHGIFTIAGRTDAVGCHTAQPDFPSQLAAHNLVFRIPTPVFGAGFLENIPDESLVENLSADATEKQSLGISGHLNRSGNDGTITRFGWKAQNKSLLIFAGEAYNVEQGVSNDVFPNERASSPDCAFNATPEDQDNDVMEFVAFMRLSAAPVPTTTSASELNGAKLFGLPSKGGIGCALCHTPTLVTGLSRFTGMSQVAIHPFSDLAVHHMGATLADNVSQGAAAGDEFRSAPLWGLGKRLFFLHDGRTSDLAEAITAHQSSGVDCAPGESPSGASTRGSHGHDTSSSTCASEANAVIDAYTTLSFSQKQDVLNFLRSL